MNIRNVKQLSARIGNGGRSKTQLAVDAVAIRELAQLLTETGLTEIEIEHGGQRLRVGRQTVPATAYSAAPAPAAVSESVRGVSVEKAPTKSHGTVNSPMVGTVFAAPEPGKPAFVSVGDTVKEGDTLFIVEAMKTMNPILAPRAGTVLEICVTDAQPVEFGQALLVLS